MNDLLANWKDRIPQTGLVKSSATAATAGAGEAPDAESLERTFAMQAYGFVQQKAPSLVKPENRIGFEVVYKNSPTNSRLVGIFAFKLGGAIVYVVCFFISGTIKPCDLLYRVDSKTFVPLNDDWVEFLSEKNVAQEGQVVPKSIAMKSSPIVSLEKLMEPPSRSSGSMIYWKQASVAHEEAQTGIAAAWEHFKEASSNIGQIPELLSDLARDMGLDRLVSMVKKACDLSFDFADSAYATGFLDRVNALELEPVVKEASAVTELTLHTGMWSPATKVAAEKYNRIGLAIDDARKEYQRARIIGQDKELETVGSAGTYDILAYGSTKDDVLVFNKFNGRLGNCLSSSGNGLWNTPQQRNDGRCINNWVMISKDGVCVTSSIDGPVFGVKGKSVGAFKSDDRIKDVPTTDGLWLVVDRKTGRCADMAIKVKEIEDEGDGVKSITYTRDYSLESGGNCCTPAPCDSSYEGPKYGLRVNPDVRSDWNRGVIGEDDGFVKVDTTDRWRPLSSREANQELIKQEHRPATVYRGNNELYIKVDIAERSPARSFGFTSKAACAAALATEFGIYGPDAVDLAHEAMTNGEANFLVKASSVKVDETEKRAHPVMMMERPRFVDGYNSTFGVAQREPQEFALSTYQAKAQIPKSRIGDQWDPGMGAKALVSQSPQELYNFSRSHKMPALMDHAVVGSLAKTFDAGAMLDSYAPKLEEAIDVLGRMLFLMYWKPDDFKQSYGADDLANKENEILSNFKSLGSFTLGILKRRRENGEGVTGAQGTSAYSN